MVPPTPFPTTTRRTTVAVSPRGDRVAVLLAPGSRPPSSSATTTTRTAPTPVRLALYRPTTTASSSQNRTGTAWTLQTTLVHQPVVAAAGTTRPSSSSEQVLFVTNHLVAVACGLDDDSDSNASAARILIWDIRRGVVIHQITATGRVDGATPVSSSSSDNGAPCDRLLAMTVANGQLYVAIQQVTNGKCVVHEYSSSSGAPDHDLEGTALQLVRKIKTGGHTRRHGAAASTSSYVMTALHVSAEHLVWYVIERQSSNHSVDAVTTADTSKDPWTVHLRILHLADGSRVLKQSWDIPASASESSTAGDGGDRVSTSTITALVPGWFVYVSSPTATRHVNAVRLRDGQTMRLGVAANATAAATTGTSSAALSLRTCPAQTAWQSLTPLLQVVAATTDDHPLEDTLDANAVPSWSVLLNGTQLFTPYRIIVENNDDAAEATDKKKKDKKQNKKKHHRESTDTVDTTTTISSPASSTITLLVRATQSITTQEKDDRIRRGTLVLHPRDLDTTASAPGVGLYAVLFPAQKSTGGTGTAVPLQVQCHSLTIRASADSETPPLQLRWISADDDHVETHAETATTSEMTSTGGSKRKSGSSATLEVLGPGQAGGNATRVVDRLSRAPVEEPLAKKLRSGDEMEDENAEESSGEGDAGAESGEPTIAERLRQMQEALDAESDTDDNNDEDDDDDNDDDMDEEELIDDDAALMDPTDRRMVSGQKLALSKFSPRHATTESLGKLLSQALQSADAALLELALDVHDLSLVNRTIASLSDDQIMVLGTALTSRLAGKPNRTAHLVTTWIQSMLKSGRWRDRTQLQTLRNLIHDRLEIFPALLQLDGRLSLLSS